MSTRSEPADLDLETLTALDAAATPVPWQWTERDRSAQYEGPELIGTTSAGTVLVVCQQGHADGSSHLRVSAADADLICAARNALPALIAEVRRLTSSLATVTGQRDDALRVVADLGGAGMCGATTEGVVIGGGQLVCDLRAGHAGWHRTSGGCDFTLEAAVNDG